MSQEEGSASNEADDQKGKELEYIVELISDKRIEKDGTAKYCVKWENYAKNESTWEPLENLEGCDWAVKDYEVARARCLAIKHADTLELHSSSTMPLGTNEEGAAASTSTATGSTARLNLNGVSSKRKREWKVEDIVGVTEVKGEKYFLLSLENHDQRPFIRASLANRLFPQKVIEFYMKHLKWRRKTITP